MGFNASALSANTIKTFVDRLNKRNKEKTTWPPKRNAVQEDIAKVLGYDSWHALNKAIDTPKPDAIHSTAPNVSQTPFVCAGPWNIPKQFDNLPLIWERVEWKNHCLVFANDETRSDFFTAFAQVNPTRPIVLIQGPLALPVDNWEGGLAQRTLKLGALMIETLDFTTVSAQEIVNVFKIWNTSSNDIYSTDVLLMVCAALVELRDAHKIVLDINTIIEHLEYQSLVALSQRTDLTEHTTKELNTYLQKFNEEQLPNRHFNTHKMIVHHWKTIEHIMERFGSSENTNHRVLISSTAQHPDKDVQSQLKAYLDWWVSGHKGGLIVVDGLHSDSHLYEFLLRRLAVYKRDGVGVVIGCANSGDFPNTQMYEQIQGRIHNQIML